jgi:hypothetical protein
MIFVMRQIAAFFTHQFLVHHAVGYIAPEVVAAVIVLNLLGTNGALPVKGLLLIWFLVLVIEALRRHLNLLVIRNLLLR